MSDDKPIIICCPNCSEPLEITMAFIGSKIQCSACDQKLLLPESKTEFLDVIADMAPRKPATAVAPPAPAPPPQPDAKDGPLPHANPIAAMRRQVSTAHEDFSWTLFVVNSIVLGAAASGMILLLVHGFMKFIRR